MAASRVYGLPWSASRAARKTSRRAASSSVAMSAIIQRSAWKSAMGLPNALRSLAYATLSSSAPRPSPTLSAPMVIRPLSRIFKVSTNPPPTSPMRRQSSTKTSSITSSAVSEERMPSFPCSGRCEKPFMPFSSRKAVTPFCRFSGSVRARTMKTSPTLPWVMNIFAPFSTQPLSLRAAVERIAAASDPLPGSVKPQAASFLPAAMSGMNRLRSSSLPNRSRWEVPRPLCEATVSASDPSQRAISSTTQATESVSSSDPPSSSGTVIPRRPSSPSCPTTSRGKRSSRSHSCACGFTSRTQKSRTIPTSLRWLSFSSKSKSSPSVGTPSEWCPPAGAFLSRARLLAHHQLARRQWHRSVSVAGLPVNPDVQGMLPTRQLAQPRGVAAAELEGELIVVGRQRRIEDQVSALAAVDPELFPDLARPVLAHRPREVAAAVDRVSGGKVGAHRRSVLRAPRELAREEHAVPVSTHALDLAQAGARHPPRLRNAPSARGAVALVKNTKSGQDQHRGRRAGRDPGPHPGRSGLDRRPQRRARRPRARGGSLRELHRGRQRTGLLDHGRPDRLSFAPAQRARQRVQIGDQLVAALLPLRGPLGAHLPDHARDALVARHQLRQVGERRLHLHQHHVHLGLGFERLAPRQQV